MSWELIVGLFAGIGLRVGWARVWGPWNEWLDRADARKEARAEALKRLPPKATALPRKRGGMAPIERWEACPICGAGPLDSCDAGLHS